MADQVKRTLVVSYEDDAERKRAEYLMDNIEEEFFSNEYQGLTRRFQGTEEEFEEVYQSLVEKVPEENVRVETAEEVEVGSFTVEDSFAYELELEDQVVDSFVRFWFGSKAPGSEKTGERTYDLYSKKFGAANVSYETEQTDSVTELQVEWQTGSQEALEGFKGLFEEELKEFEDSQS